MRKYSSAKNLLEQRRIQKKKEKHPENPKIQESRNSFNELRYKWKEIRDDLDEHDAKTILYNLDNKADKILDGFAEIKQNIGKLNDTMDTILLFTLSKDTNCPYNQRIKINNILKKKRENIILRYTNPNQNITSNKHNNANIPISTTPARKIKINSSFKNNNPAFIKKYEYRKYGAAININKTNNAPKINLKKKSNKADSSREDFSSKKSDSNYSNSLSIKSKNDSMGAIKGGYGFGYLNTKERRNNNPLNPFRTDMYKKEDKKQQKNYAIASNINKSLINKNKNDNKIKKFRYKFLLEQSDNSYKSHQGKLCRYLFKRFELRR